MLDGRFLGTARASAPRPARRGAREGTESPMIRPSVQALTKAAAAAAIAILALAGCKPLATTNASGPAGPAAPPAPARSGPLITQPAAGFSPVCHLINHARHYIDLTMYEFSDTKAEHDLAAAAQRGVTVKVVLDQREKS